MTESVYDLSVARVQFVSAKLSMFALAGWLKAKGWAAEGEAIDKVLEEVKRVEIVVRTGVNAGLEPKLPKKKRK